MKLKGEVEVQYLLHKNSKINQRAYLKLAPLSRKCDQKSSNNLRNTHLNRSPINYTRSTAQSKNILVLTNSCNFLDRLIMMLGNKYSL